MREPSTEYTPLTQEWCLFEATLGEEPPEGHVAELAACAAGRLNAVLWSWEADLDDGDGEAPPLTNAPRAPKTHWRQAAQLLPRGVQLCEGEAVRIRVRTAGGRKLSFELEGGGDEAPSGACTRIRPHAAHHAPRTEAPLPAEAAAAAAAIAATAAAAAAATAMQAVTLIGETVRPPAVASARGGAWCASRSLVRARFSSRRCRLPSPPLAPAAPDEHWLVAMRALEGALDQFGLRPRGAADNVELCDTALDLAAQPAMYGLSIADAHQAVRLFYAT